jgi:4-amino-4-deoxy-L-arabinose transferase-like glycosyltransferase
VSALSSVLARARRVPSAGWWCATVAILNVVVWTLVTPPFHVPDESSHVAYVQYLAENGEAPNDPGGPVYSTQEARQLEALSFVPTIGRPDDHTIWHELQDREVEELDGAPGPAGDGSGIQSNSNQPPLFFALDAGAYLASPWDGLLEKLAVLRLFSALLGALTTLFVFLFLREVLAESWTWTVGALAVAFQPVFGFTSGGVTPDALYFTASAALFFVLARAFRRGLTVDRGLAIGAALAVGALAKLNFLALIPGAVLGAGLLVWRARERLRGTLPAAGVAVGVLGAASIAYIVVNTLLWDRTAWGGGIETAATNVTSGGDGIAAIGVAERLSYTWQLYLPRLPFMNDQFVYFPPYETWFKGTIGIFGWLDTAFPAWVYRLALGIVIPLVVLAGVALWQRRAALRDRWPEILTYLAMVAGVLISIGFSGVRYHKDTGFVFEQARYLMPLLPLYGAAIALAALGAGRRLARPVGAALVVLALAQGVFAQLLVIGRFYA